MGDDKRTILIVEDNPGDVFMIQEMLRDLGMDLGVMVVEDGLEAMGLLKNEGNIMPDLMILDLNLPKMHGFDVLEMMKADEGLRSIPVVIMTGSLREEDEVKARSMGITDYRIKPATVEEMERTGMSLRDDLAILYHGTPRNRVSGPSVGVELNSPLSFPGGSSCPFALC